MPRILETSLNVVWVFGVVWLAVVIAWQQSNAMPTGTDIGIYMPGLSLAVLLTGWLGIKAIRAALAQQQRPGPAPLPKDAQGFSLFTSRAPDLDTRVPRVAALAATPDQYPSKNPSEPSHHA